MGCGEFVGMVIWEMETHLFGNSGDIYSLLRGEILKSMLMWDSILSLSKAYVIFVGEPLSGYFVKIDSMLDHDGLLRGFGEI